MPSGRFPFKYIFCKKEGYSKICQPYDEWRYSLQAERIKLFYEKNKMSLKIISDNEGCTCLTNIFSIFFL